MELTKLTKMFLVPSRWPSERSTDGPEEKSSESSEFLERIQRKRDFSNKSDRFEYDQAPNVPNSTSRSLLVSRSQKRALIFNNEENNGDNEQERFYNYVHYILGRGSQRIRILRAQMVNST